MSYFWSFFSTTPALSETEQPLDTKTYQKPNIRLASSIKSTKVDQVKVSASSISAKNTVFNTHLSKRLSCNLDKTYNSSNTSSIIQKPEPIQLNTIEEEEKRKSCISDSVSYKAPSSYNESWYNYMFGKRDTQSLTNLSQTHFTKKEDISQENKNGLLNNELNTMQQKAIMSSFGYIKPHWKYLFNSQVNKSVQNKTQELIEFKAKEETKNLRSADKTEANVKELNPKIDKKTILNTVAATSNKNLVLPSLDANILYDNKEMGTNKTRIMAKLTRLMGMNYLSDKKKRFSPPFNYKIQKVVIIGIHGWFPLRIYQKVIGEPTGTSKKFCEMSKSVIKEYTINHYGYELDDEAILEICLEGEGTVDQRINRLYKKLISNTTWILAMQNADTILVATHSQGTPVSTILLGELIKKKILNVENKHVCILAMAGISHGPFKYLKENVLLKYFEAKPAHELFSFLDPETDISKKYVENMELVLNNGVRVCAVASMMDQVVPIYSGVMHGFSHPLLIRAIYIDYADYKPDFLSALLSFVLLLRNYNINDYDLIVYLSEIVAGSLYSGTQGHSTIYDEKKVYEYGIQWLLQPKLPLQKSQYRYKPVYSYLPLNMYYLPWIFKCLIDDQSIKNNPNLKNELDNIIDLYTKWNPTTKMLKELKVKLEPIKSNI